MHLYYIRHVYAAVQTYFAPFEKLRSARSVKNFLRLEAAAQRLAAAVLFFVSGAGSVVLLT